MSHNPVRTARAPVGNGPALVDQIRRRLAACRSWEDLAAAIDRGEEELRQALRSPEGSPSGETAAEFRARIVREHAGRLASQVAGIERVSVSYVYRIRREAGLDARGRELSRVQRMFGRR